MTNSKHTPGPWKITWHIAWSEENGKRIPLFIGEEETEFGVRPIVTTDSGVYGPNAANACLIAAAPELFEALSLLLGSEKSEEDIGWRGTQHKNADWFSCEFCKATHNDCTLIPHTPNCHITRCRTAIAKARGEL